MTDQLTEDQIQIVQHTQVGYSHIYYDLLIHIPTIGVPYWRAKEIKQQILSNQKLRELADRVRFKNITLSEIENNQKVVERLKDTMMDFWHGKIQPNDKLPVLIQSILDGKEA